MSIIASNMIAGASGQGDGGGTPSPSYQVDRSLRFNTDDQSYLVRLPTTAGNRRTFTWSGWVKRTKLGSSQTIFGTRGSGAQEANSFDMKFDTSNRLWVGYGNGARKITSNHFRDCSAWLHIVVAYDTTQAIGDDRIKIYINGVRETNLDTDSDPSQNQETGVNNTQNQYIGAYYVPNARQHPNIYLANVHLVDGQQLESTDFGEFNTNNVWVPKAYSGTYGTNGFYLDFSDNTSTTTLGEDSSGNGNDFTLNGFSVASGADNDSLIDTPTNYTAASGNNGGNYATLNPLDSFMSSGTIGAMVTDGNLTKSNVSNTYGKVRATMPVHFGGKTYFEVTCGNNPDANDYLGFEPSDKETTSAGGFSSGALGFRGNGTLSPSTSTTYGASWSNGDVLGFYFDYTNQVVGYYLNGVDQGTAYSSFDTTKHYLPTVQDWSNATTGIFYFNFGQRPFTYTPPTGFKSLCTTNFPTPTIADGSTAMDTKLYTGNGSTQTVSGLGFSPDLVWIKSRSNNRNHALCDSVRGDGQLVYSNDTLAEQNIGASVVDLTSSGFDLGYNPNFTAVSHNHSGDSLVAWAWDAGSSTVTNTDGSITSSVRANTSAGFSVVTWTASTETAATVGHGLGKQPELIIAKSRTVADDWYVFHPSLDTVNVISQTLHLNTTASITNITGVWGNWSEMTSSTFGIYDTAGNYTNNGDMVAYCFTSVEGYSKFGTYEGGSSEPPFVYLGFKPRFILLKRSDYTDNWHIFDTARDEFNEADAQLRPSLSNAEATAPFADFLSNGFKIRVSSGTFNSNNTFIYAAFGDPFKTARAC